MKAVLVRFILVAPPLPWGLTVVEARFACVLFFMGFVFVGGCREDVPVASEPVYGCRVVGRYRHDVGAFTQGLVFEGGFLYEGTGGYGYSTVRKVGLTTGAVVQSRKLADEYFGEGIAIVGDRIVQLTWKSGVGFVYNKVTFGLIKEFTYAGEGWGLAFDGSRLIMSDGTARLRFLDPETFEEVGGVDVHDDNGPVADLNELEWVDGRIYANVWPTDRAAIIAPATGEVVGWIDLGGLYEPVGFAADEKMPNGIAYDAEKKRLFVTGKLWPSVFEVELEKAE